MMPKADNRLKSIQVLRGLAALVVVLFHSNQTIQLYHWKSVGSFPQWGEAGVDIFFVISGFVMIATTQNKGYGFKVSATFMRERLIRIVPLYWILTSVIALILLLFPAVFGKMKFDSMHVLTSYLFIPSTNSEGMAAPPIVIVGWTLIYEMWFYFIFAFLICFTRRHILLPVVIIFGSLSLLSLVGSENLYLQVYTSPTMLEFVFGCGIGTLYFQNAAFTKKISIGLVFMGLLLLFILSQYKIDFSLPRFVYGGIPSALIIAGVAFLERGNHWPNLPLFERIGDSSYSLYLTHPFTLLLTGKLILMIDPSHWLYGGFILLAMIPASILIGFAMHRLVEKPVDRYLRKAFKIGKHNSIQISAQI